MGFDSPAHLRLGRRSEVGRRGPAAAAQPKRGGGASTREEWLEAAEVVAGMAEARGLFYSRARAVEVGGWLGEACGRD